MLLPGHRYSFPALPVKVNESVTFANNKPFVLIAGPCQMESRDHALDMAGKLKALCAELNVPLVFKTSFDKANRTSIDGKRGIGLEKALEVFKEVRESLGLPVLTDVHEREQCALLAGSVDILQIPAFLCRQTDLLIAAAKSGAVVNIKKGQFLAPKDISAAARKVTDSGNSKVLLTERGVSFGYNTLISDMRGLRIMAECTGGLPVIFDATHSVQQPGGLGGASGGQREFVPVLARAAAACGLAGLFVETHENPDAAPSDGPCMMPFAAMREFLEGIKLIDEAAKKLTYGA